MDEKPMHEGRLEADQVQNKTITAKDSVQMNEERNSVDGPKILAPFAFTNFVADGVALVNMIMLYLLSVTP